MRQDYEKLFVNLKPEEPPVGLFECVIFAIKQEQELRRSKRLLFGFLLLLLVSLAATPLSGAMLISQVKNSGISYFISVFISTAINDWGTFSVFWQDFGLAILELLPITGMISLFSSLAITVFTVRLFLYKKRLLLGYLTRKFA